MQFKAGRTTVSSRRAAVGPDCRFSQRVAFRDRRRIGRRRSLKVNVRFQGNAVLTPREAAPLTARVG